MPASRKILIVYHHYHLRLLSVFSVWYGRIQPDSAVNSLLSAMSYTCFLLDRDLLSLGYVQCNLMTLQIIFHRPGRDLCLLYDTYRCWSLVSVSAFDRLFCGGLQI